MMTLHIVQTPDELPGFFHAVTQQGAAFYCLTVRGEPQCTCGHYRLCDPLAVACHAACQCQCHETEDVYA